MAKVSMEGYEYVKLVKDAALGESVMQKLVDSYLVAVNDDNDVNILREWWIPEELHKRILNGVVDQLLEHPEALRKLYDQSYVVLDCMRGYFTYNYGTRFSEGEIALTEDIRIAELFGEWDKQKELEEE